MLPHRLLALGLMMVFLSGCPKEGEPPTAAQPTPPAPPQSLPAQIPPVPSGAPVIVPEAIKGRWKAVRLRVEDKKAGTANEYTVNIGSELPIPNSSVVVKVSQFLPDLKIDGNSFTSASAELLNPSAQVQILEDGKPIFSGWLFQLFPAVHPFQHERFSITLRDSIGVS